MQNSEKYTKENSIIYLLYYARSDTQPFTTHLVHKKLNMYIFIARKPLKLLCTFLKCQRFYDLMIYLMLYHINAK